MATFSQLIEAETGFTVSEVGTSNTFIRTATNREPTSSLSTSLDTNKDGLWDGFSGQGYLDMGGEIGDAASFSIEAPEAGLYTFTFRYAHGGSPQDSRPMILTRVGSDPVSVQFPGTGPSSTAASGWDDWATAKATLQLAAGTNRLTIANTIANGPNIDGVLVTRDPAPFEPIIVQAEAGTITLAAARDADSTMVRDAANKEGNTALVNGLRPNYSGTGYLDFGNDAGDRVDYTVTVAQDGYYDLNVRYASQPFNTAQRSLVVEVNSANLGSRLFPDTGPSTGPMDLQGFNIWKHMTLNVPLKAGANTIGFAMPAGATAGPNLDRIEITAAGTGPISNQAPVVADAIADQVATVGTPFTLALPPGTFTDANTDALTLTAAGLPLGVTFDPATRTFAGTVTEAKTYTVTLTARDGAGGTVSDNFALVVSAAPGSNQAPTAVTLTPVNAQVVENTDYAAGLKVADIAVTDDGLGSHTFALTGADAASFRIVDGALIFVGKTELAGQTRYSVAVTADDPSIGLAGTVELTSATFDLPVQKGEVLPVNQAPVLAGELAAAMVAEDSPFSLDVATSFRDPDGESLAFTATGLPNWLTLTGSVLSGTPSNSDVAGPRTVTVTAKDKAGAEVVGSFDLTVTNVNDAPTLAGTLVDATVPSTGGSISLAGLTKTDIDGDVTTFGARAASGTLPAGISVEGGTLVVAGGVAPGAYAVEVFATDGTLNSSPVAFTLTVGSPVVKPFTQTLIQAEAGVLTIVDTDLNNTTTIRNPWNKEASASTTLVNGLRPGFSGSGYLDFGDTPGDKATYSVTVAEAGSYDIQIRYASNGARPLAFTLDGGSQTTLPFISTGPSGSGPAEGFNNWAIQKVTVSLAAGTHSFSLAIPTGANTGPNLDAIAITAVGATADFSARNAAPVVSETGFSVVEGTLAAGTVSARDLDGDRVDFALTANSDTDNALFSVNSRTGALSFKAAPDFEAPTDADADNAYRVEVEAFDGTTRITKILTITATDDPSDNVVNRAPVVVTTNLVADENQTAAGRVLATDADNDALRYALTANDETDNALFSIDAATGALSFRTPPDYEALGSDKSFSVEVAVSDKAATTTRSITVAVADVAEGGPVPVVIETLSPYSSQDRPQDGGTGVVLVDEGQTLSLDGNLWKRAALENSYSLTGSTKLVLDIKVGTGADAPEIVAIGFDLDEDPFDADKSLFQLGGTQTQGGFIDLRGSGTPNEDGTTRFVIDLGSHAGKAISSLVFVNDDDSKPNLGSSTFSNMQFVEGMAVGNRAPVVVGGGIADRTIPETGSIEIDLPFADADGDALAYSFTVQDGAGNAVANPGSLSIVDGVLTGSVAALGKGIFTVTVTGSDGEASASDAFTLTVENVNKAPVADDVALEPYLGSVGTAFDGFDVNGFAGYFSDPDGDSLTLSVEGLPEGLNFNEEGYVSGSPKEAGTFEVTIRATDTMGLSDTIKLTLVVEGPEVGDVVSIEAEAFTRLGASTGFFATGTATASGDRLIQLNQNAQGSVATALSQNGLVPGYYKVTVYAFDETDGASTFSLTVGDTKLMAGGSSTVTLTDTGAGTFVNPSDPRGTASQAGNLKAIAFDTVVYVGADTVATLSGQAMGAESLRIDRMTFTRVEAPNAAPLAVTLTGSVDENVASAVVGILSATDAEGDAITFTTADPRFVIAKNGTTGAVELKLANGMTLDHESDDGTQVSVIATDAIGNATTANLTLKINDLNEAPVLSGTIAGQSFEAGKGGEISLTALGASDPDAGDTVSYVAKLANGLALPAGLSLEGSVLKVAGTVSAGTYEVVVLATDGEVNSESVSFTVTVEATGTEQPEPFEPIVIQAESGTIVLAAAADASATQIRNAANLETGNQFPGGSGLRPDFSGTGYLDFGNDAGDRVTYTVTLAEAGTYNLNIRYASNDLRPLNLAINGGQSTQVAFASTDTNATNVAPEGFDVWSTLTQAVALQAGVNTISFAIPVGRVNGPNLDRIEITSVQTDTSADQDGNLFLSGPDGVLTGAQKESINFTISGRDADIVKTEISFNGGATRTEVSPDADGDFVANGAALAAGSYTATVYVTDASSNVATTSMPFVVGGTGAQPFSALIEAETFSVNDVEAVAGTPVDTVARTATNKEPNATVGNSGPGLEYNAAGLRPGFEGSGYLDMGNDIGDAASFSITTPDAGVYQLTIRYANGGADPRPMTLTVGGVQQTVPLPSTIPTPGGTAASGWANWKEMTIDVTLKAGPNTIGLINTIANGPNIDNVTVSRDDDTGPVDTREQIRFEEVIKINFEPTAGGQFGTPAGYVTPVGFVADTGSGFGARSNGYTYGWVDVENNAVTGIAKAQPTGSMRYKNDVPEASNLQKTYAHFEYPGVSPVDNERAWEMALEDGTYQLTMSIGDTGGAYDSDYVINVEGQSFMPNFVPTNLAGQSPVGGVYNPIQDGEGFRSTLVTGTVTVTDGRLTIDSIGGSNTEIQYLEIERIPDLTPNDGRTADQDFSLFAAPMADNINGQTPITIGEDGSLPTGIDPSSSFVIGVQLQAVGNRGPNIAHVENIKLVETLTGIEAEIDVQISGGSDSITIRPLAQLKENTSYTLKVQDVLDLGSITDPNGALRQFQDLTRTFVTGEAIEDVPREVAFSTQTMLNGFADGAGGYTSIEFGPDGKLYVATITGEVHRWTVNTDGTINKASQQTLSLDYLKEADGDRRGIVGFVFDPDEPNTIWISDNAPIPREAKAFDTPEFSGRISKITLGPNGSFTGATAETYITGLPRSGGDHLTNSLEFRVNPNADLAGEPDHLLYLSQGSNSAAGSPDDAWGARPERLLNAAILEIDPTRDAPAGGFDVRTEPVSLTDDPKKTFPAGQFNADGTYPGSYNPFAGDAVLKIFATGVRNAYDLVWHSNGQLYVPTNGTASGGRTPNDPTQPGLDTVIANSPKQYDYFFTVDEGGYYGHPNVLRDQYVLNGGNPTTGLDPNEVVGGNDGNRNTDGYQTGVKPDANYDLNGVYNLGYNRSPNGATEYTGDAFGSNLKGAILFAQFSTGDNVRVIKVDAQGKIIGDDVLRRPDGSVIDDYIDPLDIIQNPETGQLYLMTLNRGTGASQLILLTPAPGGVTADITADEGSNLALVAFDVRNPAAAVFQVNGLDSDITAIRVAFNGGVETTVTLDSQSRFTIDLDTLTGPITARIRVTDDAMNVASATTNFTPGEVPTTPDYVTLVTIQAEDRTPTDGTSVTAPTGSAAEIQIRDASNPETGTTGTGYINGLRPGAFGTDGNTSNTDGVPGGYADFGATNADFMTFNFSAEAVGIAILKFRYANGGTADRPLQVEVNGTIVKLQSFAPTATTTITDGWTNWSEVEVPVTLRAGQNTVTLRSVQATGPNIDQLIVMVPAAEETVPNDGEVVIDGITYVRYEAEKAELGGAPAIVTENRNQSGAFVDFQGPDNETITWTVEVGASGTYGVDILYSLGAGKMARPMTLVVNGEARETLPFVANSTSAENSWGPQATTLQLIAGVNTITLTAPGGVAPNLDLLRITKAPVSVFEPDYADINGSGRIQLETQDGSAHTVNGSTAEFFFTVAADGVYKIDTAANPGAVNGQGLTWFLNGVAMDKSAFPGAGELGEASVYLELDAGTQYRLRIVSDAPGANALDYLDVGRAPGNPNADIAVQSLDPVFLENRLHFSYIENPNAVDPTAPDRDFKDTGTVRITNTGTEALTLTDYELTGPFVLANPTQLDGLSIAAGQSVNVTVAFNRAAYTPPTSNVDLTSTVFQGALKLITNDADDPITTIDLAGFWQSRDEGGQEPNVNEVWRIFGFGNVIEGLTTRGGGENSTLSTKDVFAKTDATEVLSPYWQLADGVTEAKITHIAAFHGTGGADIRLHNPGNKGANVQMWNHEGTDNQRLLPNMTNDTTFATRTFNNGTIPDAWAGNEVFGISVAGLSTDPRLNPTGDVIVPGAQQGHTVKMFQALDVAGNVISNVYLGIMDYTGINYDYNDNMFVIEGVKPVGFGQDLRVAGLDAAAADDRLIFTSIDTPANAQQAFRNEATVTIANDGFAPLAISSIVVADPTAFQVVGTVPATIAAGASVQVTVRFVGTHTGSTAGADLYKSTLTLTSDDFSDGMKVIQLAGLAQEFSERDSEPSVAQIVEAFGYSTNVEQGELANGGTVERVGDEVLMPYLQKLDATQAVEVIQIAAFLNQGNVARLGVHGLGSSQVTNLFANDDQQGQTVLPDQLVSGAGAGASVARGTINATTPFGLYISVDGRPTYSSWTDPEANKIDPNFGQLVGDNQGHLIRFFQALDAKGQAIAGTFIGIQDYPGAGNYDYNDHMFVIKNVKAHVLTAAEDANADGINDALRLDADSDGTVNFFDTSTTPPSGPQQPFGGTAPVVRAAPLTIDSTRFDTGGQGVAYNDTSLTDLGGSQGRNEGVDIVGNNAAVGWVENGEWIEYTINVERAGLHSLSFAAASTDPGRTIRASFEQNGVTYLTAPASNVVDTNNYTSFTATAPIQVNLAAGVQTVRLLFGGGAFDLDGFTLDRVNIAPTATQTLPVQTATQGQLFSYTLPAGLFSDVDGDTLSLSVSGLPTGLTFNAGTRVISGTPAVSGPLTLTVSASDGTANASTPLTLTVAPGSASPQAPFGGTTPSFTNGVLTVDASNFDTGGQGVAYNDNAGRDGGTSFRPGEAVEFVGTQNDIGHVRPGEWIEYTINVAQAGVYDFNLLAKTPLANSTVAVSLGSGTTLATVSLQDGGTSFDNAPFQNSPSVPLTLPAGQQTIRLTFDGTPQAGSAYLLDLRSFTFDYREPESTAQTPFGGTVPAFTNGVLTRDASLYDEGGQGIAYNDAAGLQGGTNGGRPSSAVEQTTAGDIGWINPGEWLEYTVTVPTAGAYDVDLLLSNGGGAGRSAKVDFFKLGAGTPYATSGAVANPSTGSFNTFATRGADDITLEAGPQIVRVTFSGGSQDFRSFALTAPSNPQTPYGGTVPSFTNGRLTVDASNFDTGGQGVAYNDNAGREGGTSFRPGDAVEFVGTQNDIGYVRPGEWVEYTINVPASGTYDLSVLAKTPLDNATVAVSLSGGATLATVRLQDGGASFDSSPFQASAPVALTLPTGQQTIRLTFEGTPQAGSAYVLDLREFTLNLRSNSPLPLQVESQQNGDVSENSVLPESSSPSTGTNELFVLRGEAEEVFALYDAMLDRTPDVIGHQYFTAARSNGGTLNELAELMLNSQEGQARLGLTDNIAFIEALYQTALHRAGEPAGVANWVAALENGLSRAEAVVNFASSQENLATLGMHELVLFEHNLFADAVARIYHGLLDRAPDANGMSYFTEIVKTGATLEKIAQMILGSEEYSDRFPDLNNGAFVDSLYDGALGRQAEASGWMSWTTALANGESRESVAIGVTQSFEAHIHLDMHDKLPLEQLLKQSDMETLYRSIEIA